MLKRRIGASNASVLYLPARYRSAPYRIETKQDLSLDDSRIEIDRPKGRQREKGEHDECLSVSFGKWLTMVCFSVSMRTTGNSMISFGYDPSLCLSHVASKSITAIKRNSCSIIARGFSHPNINCALWWFFKRARRIASSPLQTRNEQNAICCVHWYLSESCRVLSASSSWSSLIPLTEWLNLLKRFSEI